MWRALRGHPDVGLLLTRQLASMQLLRSAMPRGYEAVDGLDSRATNLEFQRLGRSDEREVWLSVPGVGTEPENEARPRLAAPPSLLRTIQRHVDSVGVQLLSGNDENKNVRPWHTKKLYLGRWLR